MEPSTRNEQQRERSRKARDSTLRAAALTSPRTFETYFASLLQHVTLGVMHLFSLCQVLERGEPHYGALVRSIRFEHLTDYSNEANLKLLTAIGETYSALPTTAVSFDRIWKEIEVGVKRCYRQLINLQSLVILDPLVSFFHHFFHHKIGEQVKPHSFLGRSLKRLFIQLWGGGPFNVNPNLSGRNATWLLVFCRQIEEASLAFQMSIDDSKYLSELAGTLDGLSSVKKLAIKVEFVYSEVKQKTWWGTAEEQNREHKGDNRKNESIINFLQSTNKLDALEVYIPPSDVREGDHSQFSLDCLSALPRSFQSLRHLRLLGEIFGDEPLSLWNPPSFQVLRVLTLDWHGMCAVAFLDLPQSIEILCLPCYLIAEPEFADEDDEEDFEEEKLIGEMIDHKRQPSLPSLKEVVVPSRPIGPDGKGTISPQEVQLWTEGRRGLEKADLLRSGKVRLRTAEIGESVGDASKGEVFWSTVRSWGCSRTSRFSKCLDA